MHAVGRLVRAVLGWFCPDRHLLQLQPSPTVLPAVLIPTYLPEPDPLVCLFERLSPASIVSAAQDPVHLWVVADDPRVATAPTDSSAVAGAIVPVASARFPTPYMEAARLTEELVHASQGAALQSEGGASVDALRRFLERYSRVFGDILLSLRDVLGQTSNPSPTNNLVRSAVELELRAVMAWGTLTCRATRLITHQLHQYEQGIRLSSDPSLRTAALQEMMTLFGLLTVGGAAPVEVASAGQLLDSVTDDFGAAFSADLERIPHAPVTAPGGLVEQPPILQLPPPDPDAVPLGALQELEAPNFPDNPNYPECNCVRAGNQVESARRRPRRRRAGYRVRWVQASILDVSSDGLWAEVRFSDNGEIMWRYVSCENFRPAAETISPQEQQQQPLDQQERLAQQEQQPPPAQPPSSEQQASPKRRRVGGRATLALLLLGMLALVRGQPATPPAFTSISGFKVVSEFFGALRGRDGSFIAHDLAAQQNKWLAARNLAHRAEPAHSMDVRAMFDPYHCGHGARQLPRPERTLQIAGFDALHRNHCSACQLLPAPRIAPDCYFAHLRRCLLNGFLPPRLTQSPPVPQYIARGADGNHPSAHAHWEFTDAQVTKLLNAKVLLPHDGPVTVSPLGVTIPTSKRQLAYSLTGIDAVDDASYAAMKPIVQEYGVDVPKRRLIVDATGPGVNEQFDNKPFSYITINDLLRLVRQGDWLAVADVTAYFHNYPLAVEIRPRFGVCWKGQRLVFGKLPFGGSPNPYLASVMTAEICAGLRALGIDIVAMVDDFGLRDGTREAALNKLHVLTAAIEACGMEVAPDKTQLGQLVRFIGFLVDTVRMSVRFDPASAKGFLLVLRQAIWCLTHDFNLDRGMIRHMAGKLQHYAYVLQAGKVHIATLWAYLRYHKQLSASGRSALIDDLVWWAERVSRWAIGDPCGSEFPILNAATLLADPLAFLVAVTDYSGPDGVGGCYGRPGDTDPLVFSHSWSDGECPSSSMAGELYGLLHVLQIWAGAPVVPTAKVLLWVTDNLGAAQSVNAGRCFDPDGLRLLRVIFDILEALGWVVVALWHDRDHNSFADFLSHLASSLGRPDVSSSVAQLQAQARGGDADRDQEGLGRGAQPLEGLPGLLHDAPDPPDPSDVRLGERLPLSLGGDPRRLDADPRQGEVQREGHGDAAGTRVADGATRAAAPTACGPAAVRGHIGGAASECTTDEADQRDHQPVGPGRSGLPAGGCFAEVWSPGPSPRRGAHIGSEAIRCGLDQGLEGGAAAAPTDEVRAHWGRSVRDRRPVPRPPVRRPTAAAPVAAARLGQPPAGVHLPRGRSQRHRHVAPVRSRRPPQDDQARRPADRPRPTHVREPLAAGGRGHRSPVGGCTRPLREEGGPVEIGYVPDLPPRGHGRRTAGSARVLEGYQVPAAAISRHRHAGAGAAVNGASA